MLYCYFQRSAGCIIYEIITLEKAFDGTSYSKIINAVTIKPHRRLEDTSMFMQPILDL
jgi:hypothetical protein